MTLDDIPSRGPTLTADVLGFPYKSRHPCPHQHTFLDPLTAHSPPPLLKPYHTWAGYDVYDKCLTCQAPDYPASLLAPGRVRRQPHVWLPRHVIARMGISDLILWKGTNGPISTRGEWTLAGHGTQ